MNQKTMILCLILIVPLSVVGQKRIKQASQILDSISQFEEGLNDSIKISLSRTSLQEFVRAIGMASNTNLNISPDIKESITNNFDHATTKEILLFLCKEYNLQLDVTGTIISLERYLPKSSMTRQRLNDGDIMYDDSTDLLSLNLKLDTLTRLAERLTRISSYNVIVAPEIQDRQVSSFIRNRPFYEALNSMAFANGISARRANGNFIILESLNNGQRPILGQNTSQITPFSKPSIAGVQISVKNALISVVAHDASIREVITSVAYEAGIHFYLFDAPDENTTLYIENATFEEFLKYILNGTTFTYKVSDGIILIGEDSEERLRTTELVSMQNRTIESVLEFIPEQISRGLEIREFLDLNAFIVSGSYSRIDEFKALIEQIDKPVPVVLIDVMIVEVKKDFNMEAGMKFVLGGENVPSVSDGSYNGSNGGFQATLSSRTLNTLLSSLAAPGLVNLGNLSPNFYASIKALETNGVLKRRSTPKLSTMNGVEASLSLGEQTFYAEVNNSFIGTQNPTLSESKIYKSINAELIVKITPYVSGDEQITLYVDFSESNFTSRIEEQAPPGSLSKSFSSKIRVRNGETILLGGLDEQVKQKSGEGLPFLARIPILKWILGSNTQRDSENQINIFIQPTIIY